MYKGHGKRTLVIARNHRTTHEKQNKTKDLTSVNHAPVRHSHRPMMSPKSKPTNEFLSPAAPSVGSIRGLSVCPKLLGTKRGLLISATGMIRGLALRRMLVLLPDLERAKSLLDCERFCASEPERDKSRTMPRDEECEDVDEARRCRTRCMGSTLGMLAMRAKTESTMW